MDQLPWNVSDREFDALLRSTAGARYTYFVHKVADAEGVWALNEGGGLVQVGDDVGTEYLAVWPHARYALAWGKSNAPTALATRIPIRTFIDVTMAQLSSSGRAVVVFATPTGSGVRVEPERLRTDLELELSKY